MMIMIVGQSTCHREMVEKKKKLRTIEKPSGGYKLLSKVHWQPLMLVA